MGYFNIETPQYMVRKDPPPFETLTIPVARADFVLGAPVSTPFLVGGNNRLKPALRLISDRLVIEELKEAKAITSYTRWVDAVQARGVENPEMSER